MEIVLFRHGPAADRDGRRWPDDDARPLTPEGVRATRRAARGLARLVGGIDRLYTSPALRAHRTAELLRAELEAAPELAELEELAPGAPAALLLDRLRRSHRLTARIAVVGHEPTLGELIGLGLVGEAVSVARLAKAGAASVEFPRAAVPGGGRLDWLITRKQLIRLAG
jgi:phosphohistidine phosphatase